MITILRFDQVTIKSVANRGRLYPFVLDAQECSISLAASERSTFIAGLDDPVPDMFSQFRPRELDKVGEEPGHRSDGWGRQIQRLGQRNEADAELQDLSRSLVIRSAAERPRRSNRQTTIRCREVRIGKIKTFFLIVTACHVELLKILVEEIPGFVCRTILDGSFRHAGIHAFQKRHPPRVERSGHDIFGILEPLEALVWSLSLAAHGHPREQRIGRETSLRSRDPWLLLNFAFTRKGNPMLTKVSSAQRFHASRPRTGSVFKIAGEYLKEALSTKRCVKCRWTGFESCGFCKGKGMILGEAWFIPGCTRVSREPCRHCIGTGKHECHHCNRAQRTEPISRPHY